MQQKKNIIWCMRTQIWSACRHNFLSFQTIFCFFTALLTPKIKIWKKCKKTPGHIILLHMCTVNQDHIMYGSWDMKFNRQNFFVILGNCLLFYHPLFYQIAAAAHRQCAGYASAVRGSVGNKFSSYGDLKFKKFHFVVHLGITSWR